MRRLVRRGLLVALAITNFVIATNLAGAHARQRDIVIAAIAETAWAAVGAAVVVRATSEKGGNHEGRPR